MGRRGGGRKVRLARGAVKAFKGPLTIFPPPLLPSPFLSPHLSRDTESA
jgi:hypothetical protein